MGKYINSFLCTVILLAALIYHLYIPVSPNALEPSKQRWFAAHATLVWDYIDLVTMLGLYNNNIAAMRSLPKPRSEQIIADDETQATDDLFSGVRVRIYRPTKFSGTLPGLIYLHGGGWCLSNIDDYDELVRNLTRKTKVVLVSIDYRLAPEHPFPIPMEDCYAATSHFLMHASKYGVDSKRIGIIGDDAGGNLAAAVSLKLQDQQGHNIQESLKLQVLIYPALQTLDFSLPSYLSNTGRRSNPGTLNTEAMVEFWKYYAFGEKQNILTNELLENRHLSDELKETDEASYVNQSLLPREFLGSNHNSLYQRTVNNNLYNEVKDIFLNQYFAPLIASNDSLRKLPSTYLLTCDFDPLRDDGFMFYERMRSLNVDIIHKHWSGMAHGFFVIDYYEVAEKALDDVVDFIHDKL